MTTLGICLDETRLLLGVISAERGSRDQKLAFGALHRLQFHVAILLASFIDLGSQIIDLTRFRLESDGRTDALRGFLESTRLPIRADLMIARVYRKEKIGLALVGPDPCAIEPYPHRRAMHHVLEDIDECFACFRRSDGVLLVIGLYIELRFVRAAATTCRSRWSRVLCKDRRCEKKDCENGFPHVDKT